MYATPEDIRARYKEVYLILAGKDAEGRPDTAAVEQALAEAASEIIYRPPTPGLLGTCTH